MGRVTRIISGGQTGVDRAALDFAIARGLDYGGWCPNGGWAEDAPEPPGVLARYPGLRETPAADPRQRTDWNARDTDATLVFVRADLLAASPGTLFAIDCAKQHAKPLLIVDSESQPAVERIRTWLAEHPDIHALNIAGPRESEAPGIYDDVRGRLEELLPHHGRPSRRPSSRRASARRMTRAIHLRAGWPGLTPPHARAHSVAGSEAGHGEVGWR
jgi:hypothetical protein